MHVKRTNLRTYTQPLKTMRSDRHMKTRREMLFMRWQKA